MTDSSSRFYSPISGPKKNLSLEVVEAPRSALARTSFQNVMSLWKPEIDHFCKDVKKMLVGTKLDLRIPGIREGSFVSQAEAEKLAKKAKFHKYCECSANTGANVHQVINSALELHLQPTISRKRSILSKKCVVL